MNKAAILFAAVLAFAISPLIVDPFTGYDPSAFPVLIERHPIQPAGWAFSIWGLIYVWLVAHGLFGILAMMILVWMLAKRYVANRPGLGRGMTAAFGVWSMSIMAHSAMRLAVVPLMIALALVSWRLQAGDKHKTPEVLPSTVLESRQFHGQP